MESGFVDVYNLREDFKTSLKLYIRVDVWHGLRLPHLPSKLAAVECHITIKLVNLIELVKLEKLAKLVTLDKLVKFDKLVKLINLVKSCW